ncbi:MAG TPA: hypothetical protein VFN09_06680 [Rhodanobacteraceae bacterium]|nr:hypothetical protein [Rhodanobacteraceae bacterium]
MSTPRRHRIPFQCLFEDPTPLIVLAAVLLVIVEVGAVWRVYTGECPRHANQTCCIPAAAGSTGIKP